MKTIVVPTDFSTSAQHATLYAAEIAKAINASVLLLHVYQIPVTMSEFPVLIVSGEELKNNADAGLQKAKEAAEKAMPGVPFKTESKMGDIVDEIQDSCSKRDVIALVAGTKDMSGFERFLLGNTALTIAKNCNFPVITVQESAPIKIPKRIALAVDNDDKIPAEKIQAFIQLFGAQLHVVHVETEDKPSPIHLPDTLTGAAYHSLKEDDVAKGIHNFVEQNSIDLVLILPHKHNLFERIFFKGHTSELISEMPVPVLCISESTNE
jgi:nucleotide-binding universal stress UspA family protein